MGNEVSAQRVTFGSHPQFEQVDQETSLNTEAPFTKKRKLEDFEESLSSQIPNKRRKLNQNEDGSHIIHTPKSLIIILKCDSLSSLQSVSQNRGTSKTGKDGTSSREAEMSPAVLDRLDQQGLDYINGNKQKERRLRKHWKKATGSKTGRDPIGTPSSVRLKATIPTVSSTSSELTTTSTSEIKDPQRIKMKFRMKYTPSATASTSSATEEKIN
ncbi:hypothetical protein ACHAO1_007386 [Botrytis cinerea]